MVLGTQDGCVVACCGSTLQQLWCCRLAGVRRPDSAACKPTHQPSAPASAVQDVAVTTCAVPGQQPGTHASDDTGRKGNQLEAVTLLAVSCRAGSVDILALPCTAASVAERPRSSDSEHGSGAAMAEQSVRDVDDSGSEQTCVPPLWLHSHSVHGATDKGTVWTPLCWVAPTEGTPTAMCSKALAECQHGGSSMLLIGGPTGTIGSWRVSLCTALRDAMVKHSECLPTGGTDATSLSAAQPAASALPSNAGQAAGRWQRASQPRADADSTWRRDAVPRAGGGAAWQRRATQLLVMQQAGESRHAGGGMLFSMLTCSGLRQARKLSDAQGSMEAVPHSMQLWTTSIDRTVSVRQQIPCSASLNSSHGLDADMVHPVQLGCVGAPVTAALLLPVRHHMSGLPSCACPTAPAIATRPGWPRVRARSAHRVAPNGRRHRPICMSMSTHAVHLLCTAMPE